MEYESELMQSLGLIGKIEVHGLSLKCCNVGLVVIEIVHPHRERCKCRYTLGLVLSLHQC